MLYKKNKTRPLMLSDLKPYLDTIGKSPIPFTVVTKDKEKISGTIRKIEPRESNGTVNQLEIIAAEATMQDPSGRNFGDGRKDYSFFFNSPLFLSIEKDELASTLALKSGGEDIYIKSFASVKKVT